jgi:Uma2 family endonuclease
VNTATLTRPPVPAGPPPLLFTAEQAMRMDAAGVFDPAERIELLDGVLYRKPPVNPPHASALLKLARLIDRLCGDAWAVRPQVPLLLSPASLPQPDIVVATGRLEDYDRVHPTPAETALVVEVSDASLRADMGEMMRLYADAGIPEYWVVDVNARVVHVHTLPQPGGYASVAVVGPAGTLAVTLRGQAVGSLPVKEFLP